MADCSKELLPEPFNGSGDISAYVTQFDLLSSLQSWFTPLSDAEGRPRTNAAGERLHNGRRPKIFFSGYVDQPLSFTNRLIKQQETHTIC